MERGDRLELLGDLAGGDVWADVSAVSGDGSILVGRSSTGTAYLTNEAFLWHAGIGLVNLADFLTEICGLDLTGWTLLDASHIVADGRFIVGTGVNPDGQTEARRAVIHPTPEPSTGLLVSMGLRRLRAA